MNFADLWMNQNMTIRSSPCGNRQLCLPDWYTSTKSVWTQDPEPRISTLITPKQEITGRRGRAQGEIIHKEGRTHRTSAGHTRPPKVLVSAEIRADGLSRLTKQRPRDRIATSIKNKSEAGQEKERFRARTQNLPDSRQDLRERTPAILEERQALGLGRTAKKAPAQNAKNLEISRKAEDGRDLRVPSDATDVGVITKPEFAKHTRIGPTRLADGVECSIARPTAL